jgi:hypothetical protein
VGARNYKDIDPAAGIMNRIDQNAELMLAMSAILSEEESSGTG